MSEVKRKRLLSGRESRQWARELLMQIIDDGLKNHPHKGEWDHYDNEALAGQRQRIVDLFNGRRF